MWSIPDHAGLQSRGDCKGFVDVISEDSCCQPVLCGIGSLDDFTYAAETHNLLHRAKYLQEDGREILQKQKNEQ